jgi:SNF2 family DNA or RNA helicase
MIALHIAFIDGAPFLWGERGDRGNPDGGDVREAGSGYPFDPGEKGLRDALKIVAPGMKSPKDGSRKVIWLPSRGNVPSPSSPVMGTAFGQRQKVIMRPYETTVRKLSPEEFLEIAALAGEEGIAGEGVLFGSSVRWCGQMAKVMVNAAVKETFLPGAVRNGEWWEARWLPLPDESDERALDSLAVTMPGACRCMTDSAEAPPETPPEMMVRRLLAHGLDFLARHATEAGSSGRGKRVPESIHEAWLTALVSDDAVIRWSDEKETKEFARQIEQWRRPVDITAQSPYRFCFRLSEPAEDAPEKAPPDSWNVEYLLQPRSDPSLLVPVADMWNPKSGVSRQMEKYGGAATEFMLTALGQASGVSPGVADSLKHKHPGGFALDASGAWQFLREQAEVLRGAGFTVLLPSWWMGRGPARKLGLKAQVKSQKMQGGSGMTLDEMVSFDLAACLGEETLDIEELRALARLKAPLVKVRGQWTQIDQNEIAAAIRFLEKRERNSLSAREALVMALGADRQFGGLTVDKVVAEGWMKDLLEQLSGRRDFETLPTPERFEGRLRPYQERGYSWLAFLRRWGLGACLADDMGLGKTVQTLALIQRERESGENRPVLLICPTSVVNNWRKETEKFTPDVNVLIHHGPDRRKKEAFAEAASEHSLVVSSYALLHRDIDFLKDMDWAGIILDEAQNVKNPETKQSKAARAIKAGYRIALTGTPVENHVGDLWALMDFLNPGLLGTQSAFKRNFFQPIQIWHQEGASQRLRALTGPFILRRLKTDRSIITDLPEKIEQKEFCTLTKEQASLYKAVLDDLTERLETAEGIERRGLVLATLSKLKQVCNHPAQFIGDRSSLDHRSGKLARLEELLTEIREVNERTLVFSQFAEMGGLLQRHFQDRYGEEVFFLHGGVLKKKRDEMVERFQNDPRAPKLFILSLKAGGTGLNLTGANHVVHYDRWWNPAVENQATDRAFRIGQNRTVEVHKFIVSGTLEERIDEMIERKTGIAGQVVGSGEQWLTELSNEDLRKLIELSSDAVGD